MDDFQENSEVMLAATQPSMMKFWCAKPGGGGKCTTCTEIVKILGSGECVAAYMRSKFMETKESPDDKTKRVHEKHCKQDETCSNFKDIANSVEYKVKDGKDTYIYTEVVSKKGETYKKKQTTFTPDTLHIFVNGIVNNKIDILAENTVANKPSHYWRAVSLKIDGISHTKESLGGLYEPIPGKGAQWRNLKSNLWSRDVYVVFERNIGLWRGLEAV